MREVNAAFDQAVRRLLGRPEQIAPPSEPRPPTPTTPPRPVDRPSPPLTGPWVQYDEPSFTIDALPVDAFAALERVGGELGHIVGDDPPYLLEVVLRQPAPCW